eukprot:1185304-Rhodomonas_salina.1
MEQNHLRRHHSIRYGFRLPAFKSAQSRMQGRALPHPRTSFEERSAKMLGRRLLCVVLAAALLVQVQAGAMSTCTGQL